MDLVGMDAGRVTAGEAGTDPVAGMVRLADHAVYGLTAVAALISAVLVGLEPWPLLLIALAVAPPAAEACGLRVPPVVAGPLGLAMVTALILLDAPKTAILVAVALAAWVALRSASAPLNLFMIAAVSALSYVDFSRRPAAPHDGYLSSGSIVWGAAALYATATGVVLRRTTVLAAELARAQHRLVAAAATDERRRIAQDVHDLVAHSLAVALLNITGARRTMRRDPALADEALARAEQVGRDSLAGIRRAVGLLGGGDTPATGGSLRADRDSGGPLPDAHDLAALVDGYRRSGLAVELTVTGGLGGLDQAAGSVLFRTVREALANVLHHAGGTATWITVEMLADSVRVTVRNARPGPGDGVLPAARGPRPGGGMGLAGMAERVHALGGSVVAGPRDGGWEVTATIPTVAVGPVGGGPR
ncbi:histidine kinase [Parafrankia sp. Ea1.12]|uniref:sensor histidine kinase n=1 Tax=Parafrankia sp. Ea1.12 TaxID=573499 RepID=UPI001F1FCDCF|nr:histidine kinase [Parafrankia sp. Ea1.12]